MQAFDIRGPFSCMIQSISLIKFHKAKKREKDIPAGRRKRSFSFSYLYENKAVYTASSVACFWAGAVTISGVREGTYGTYAYVPVVGLRMVSD